MEMTRDITTIQLSRTFKDYIAGKAIRKDESYEEILKRLLKFKEKVSDTEPVKA